jgi:hypothetical protein
VIVDENDVALDHVSCMACHMEFANRGSWNGGEILRGINADIVRADIQVVDIEQQPTICAVNQFGDERRFAQGRVPEPQIA